MIELIRREESVLRKLFDGTHPNVIHVSNLGYFNFSPFYFIDMEACALNLRDYLIPASERTSSTAGLPSITTDHLSHSRSIIIWDIMSQIASGLSYIHDSHQIHLAVKPSNSTFFNTKFNLFQYCFR